MNKMDTEIGGAQKLEWNLISKFNRQVWDASSVSVYCERDSSPFHHVELRIWTMLPDAKWMFEMSDLKPAPTFISREGV